MARDVTGTGAQPMRQALRRAPRSTASACAAKSATFRSIGASRHRGTVSHTPHLIPLTRANVSRPAGLRTYLAQLSAAWPAGSKLRQRIVGQYCVRYLGWPEQIRASTSTEMG